MYRLTQAVVSATHKLKISQSELSRRLGKSRNYISNMLDGCSTAKQDELVNMINRVAGGEIFKSDDAIIAELSESLESTQQLVYIAAQEAQKLRDEIKQQKSAIHNLKETIDRCDDAYGILKKRHEDAQKNLSKVMESGSNRQILLNQSEENSIYWMNKVPKTAMQALKLFFKLLFGGKA